jgi:hypothetical protein
LRWAQPAILAQDDKTFLGESREEDWDFVWDGEYVSAGAGGED